MGDQDGSYDTHLSCAEIKTGQACGQLKFIHVGGGEGMRQIMATSTSHDGLVHISAEKGRVPMCIDPGFLSCKQALWVWEKNQKWGYNSSQEKKALLDFMPDRNWNSELEANHCWSCFCIIQDNLGVLLAWPQWVIAARGTWQSHVQHKRGHCSCSHNVLIFRISCYLFVHLLQPHPNTPLGFWHSSASDGVGS